MADPRRAAERWLATVVRSVATAALLALAAGCGVTRTPEATGRQPSDLLSLRRAGEALTERIQEEERHVAALQRRLDEVRLEEDRLTRDYDAAEEGFQTIQSDLDGTLAEVQAAEDELETLNAELASLRAEQAALVAERTTAEQAVEASRRESIAWLALRRDVVNELLRWRERLEPYRAQWGVEPTQWNALLQELGLWAKQTAAGPAGTALGRAPSGDGDDAAATPGVRPSEDVEAPATAGDG